MSRTFAWLYCYASLFVLVCIVPGCSSPLFRGQSPDGNELQTLVDGEDSKTRYIGDLAVPWGEQWLKVEGIALVTQLDGTGSDPPPSPILDQLKREMQLNETRGIAEALASPDTAMVMVGGYIPPGATKGDTFDLQVSIPPRSRTQSLRGGWLMPARMRQVMIVEQQLHSGDVAAMSQGEVLVDALFSASEDDVSEKRGRVLGGGVVTKPRPFGLGIYEQHSSVRTSAMIGAAINDRFHHFHRGEKSGVANPLRDNQVELAPHPRYKHNFARYMRVLMNIAVGETPSERSARLVALDRMLQEPTTAERAAVQLEAMGQEGLPILRRGLKTHDSEVRFYAAEALAYMDEPDASQPLLEAARDIRAFRWRALTALSAMEHISARDALAQLMTSPSAETSYGAFRALRSSDASEPLVRGSVLGKSFGYHMIATPAEPMIHFSRTQRPELVLFGHDLRIEPPAFLFAGKHILIKGTDDGRLKISQFKAGQEPDHTYCSSSVDELVQSIVEAGGGYQEVLQALSSAKKNGYLAARVEVGALPSRMRVYRRDEQSNEPHYHVTNPVPDMFADRLDDETSSAEKVVPASYEEEAQDARERTKRGWFGRMAGWFSDE